MTDDERGARIGELLGLRIPVEELLETIDGRLEELGYEHTARSFGVRPPILRGEPVIRQRIIRALKRFDSEYPDTNDYRSWLENRVYKYALQYEGKLYPPKPIVRLARGCDRLDFEVGEAFRVLRRLGFEVIDKPTL